MYNIVGGEPEQAVKIDELISDVTYSKFNVQCKLTRWIPHYLTPHQWIY